MMHQTMNTHLHNTGNRYYLQSLCTCLLLLCVHISSAQESCAEKLLRANTFYEQGRLNEAIELANPCILSGTTTDKWQAYRLLAMAYLANDQRKEARTVTENMMELNPLYKPSPLKDPPELIKMIHSVVVIPKFSVGLAFNTGFNYTYPVVKGVYNLLDYTKQYRAERDFLGELSIGYFLGKNISIHTGLTVSSNTFSISFTHPWGNTAIKEKLNYLTVPVYARYMFFYGRRLRPFVEAGVSGSYLLSSSSDFTTSTDTSQQVLKGLDSRSRHNVYNYGVSLGAGLSCKAGNGNVLLALYYGHNFANITRAGERYNSISLRDNYLYIDDDITINNFSIMVGYTFYMNYRVIRNAKNQ